MAFGTPVQEKTAVQNANVATLSLTLDSTPTDDNVLVACGFCGPEGGTPTLTITTPSGFAVDAAIGGNDHFAHGQISTKVASSESTGITQTSSSADEQSLIVLEYDEMDTAALVVGSAIDSSNPEISSRASGTVNNTASPADALAVAAFGGYREPTSKSASITYTNSYAQEAFVEGASNGDNECYVATLILSATGNTDSTASWTSGDTRTLGGLVVLKKAAAAGASVWPSPVKQMAHLLLR